MSAHGHSYSHRFWGGRLVKQLVFGIVIILIVIALFVSSPLMAVTAPKQPNVYDSSTPLISSLIPQTQRVPNSFDDALDQPPAKYNPRRDRTRIQLRRDPRLDRELIRSVTDPLTLSVRENPLGSDWGPDVSKYLEYCDIHEPAWWCAAFVSYQVHQASLNTGVTSKWPAFANCVDIYKWAKRHKLLLVEPGVPSVMLIPGNRKKPYKHTGIVVQYDPATRTIVTIEGNSNNDGSNNGIGVFRLRRKATGLTFVKIN
jgi:hypothetical protein